MKMLVTVIGALLPCIALKVQACGPAALEQIDNSKLEMKYIREIGTLAQRLR